MKSLLIAAIVGFMLVGAIAGCAESSKEAVTTSTSAPATRGVFVKDCSTVLGDQAACRALTVTKVTCRWDGDQIRVAATFANKLAAHVTVHVVPTYTLANAGQHGDGITNWTDVGIDAGATREWTHELGRPDGVSGTPAIRACRPTLTLNGVDLG